MYGKAKKEGCTHIWTIGGYGSNHAVASLLHSHKAGITASSLLFPIQPPQEDSGKNLKMVLSRSNPNDVFIVRKIFLVFSLIYWLIVVYLLPKFHKKTRHFVMRPGGASPEGCLGHVNAAIEIAHQIREGNWEEPSDIVLSGGSFCTTAGIVVGISLCRFLGLGFATIPNIHCVRIGNSIAKIPSSWVDKVMLFWVKRLSMNTCRLLISKGVPNFVTQVEETLKFVEVNGKYLGRGYGYESHEGKRAQEEMRKNCDLYVDLVYSAKSAACLLDLIQKENDGNKRKVVMFWSTKNSVDTCEEAATIDWTKIRSQPAAYTYIIQSEGKRD